MKRRINARYALWSWTPESTKRTQFPPCGRGAISIGPNRQQLLGTLVGFLEGPPSSMLRRQELIDWANNRCDHNMSRHVIPKDWMRSAVATFSILHPKPPLTN